MKSELQKKLALVAPAVHIETIWEHDPDERWSDPLNKDWTEGEDPDDWQAWQSEVRATAIHQGELLTGSGYLGGTWEKFGDNPYKTNPEISGYESQKTEEALGELLDQLKGNDDSLSAFLLKQINDAITTFQ